MLRHTLGHMSYDTGPFARATVSGTLYNSCGTHIRYTDADTVGMSRSYRTASLDKSQQNTVPRTYRVLGTWSVIDTTDSFHRKNRCKFRMNHDTIDIAYQSKIDQLHKKKKSKKIIKILKMYMYYSENCQYKCVFTRLTLLTASF